MSDKHLTGDELDLYIEKELDDQARAEIERHLTDCAQCRGRLARDRRMNRALQTLPRQDPPRDLAARISSAVEVQVLQDKLRRSRMPFIFMATIFSLLLLIWFGFQMVIAFEENATLDFLSLLMDRPDIVSAYSIDAVWAVIEALPLGEIALTLFALFTVIVLAQQWVDTVRPQTSFSKSRWSFFIRF
jgi:predicted anti-sigma-YlaC factor YlaD